MNVMKRLQALEDKLKPKELIVIAIVDGQEVAITARECIDRKADFVRVKDGNNLEELDELLSIMTGRAFEDQGTEDNNHV